jgi:cell division protease FtsH
MSRAKDYSEDTAILIDSEIKRIVTDCAGRARQMIETNLEKLHTLARALLERESLDGAEIARLLACRRSRERRPRRRRSAGDL